jgi:hypothetical protein
MSSFNIGTVDLESYSKIDDGTILAGRDIDMHVGRPGSARFFTLLIWTVNWILTHVTIGNVIMARRTSGLQPLLTYLVSSAAIVISIPQLRNSMPDAPGLDGESRYALLFSYSAYVVFLKTGVLIGKRNLPRSHVKFDFSWQMRWDIFRK